MLKFGSNLKYIKLREIKVSFRVTNTSDPALWYFFLNLSQFKLMAVPDQKLPDLTGQVNLHSN